MQRSNKEVQEFYNSSQWVKVRNAYKKYRYGLCERCGMPGRIVHHKVHINMNNIYNPEITLSFDNLELLCQDCHNKEHFSKNDFNECGDLKNKNENIFDLVGIYKKNF